MKMKSGNERKKIIRELLNRTDQEFTDEELIHQLIMTNITENSNETEKLSFGQRASDAVAKFAGSWAFIFSFIAVMVGWMAVNIILGSRSLLSPFIGFWISYMELSETGGGPSYFLPVLSKLSSIRFLLLATGQWPA